LVVKNGSNTRRRTASGMPMPVSWTAQKTVSSCRPVVIVIVPPLGIASSALKTMFVSASRSSAASAAIGGRSPWFTTMS
jgi:hypothetical protein